MTASETNWDIFSAIRASHFLFLFSLISLNQLSFFLYLFFANFSVWDFLGFLKLDDCCRHLCCCWCIHSFVAAVEIYLSPVETHCSNVDYFPDMDDEKLQPNDDAITRLHLARSCVALFVLRWVNYTRISIACVCIWHTAHTWTTMADALPTPMVMRFMCARNGFCLRVCACVYLLFCYLFVCVFWFSCRFFSRSHAQVVVCW